MHIRRAFILIASSFSIFTVATAQDAPSARKFVETLYQHYQSGKRSIDFAGPRADQYFSRKFIRIMKADQSCNHILKSFSSEKTSAIYLKRISNLLVSDFEGEYRLIIRFGVHDPDLVFADQLREVGQFVSNTEFWYAFYIKLRKVPLTQYKRLLSQINRL